MGRMHDALKKAEAERERRRREAAAGGSGDMAPAPTPKSEPKREEKIARDVVSEPKKSGQMSRLLDRVGRKSNSEAASDAPVVAKTAPMAQVDLDDQPAVSTTALTVGHIPADRLLAYHEPRDPRVEQIRTLKANVHALNPSPGVIGLTSAVEREGATLVCANLACVFAEETTSSILVVDANLRAPSLHEYFAVEANRHGLSDVLQGDRKPEEVIIPTPIPRVHFVGAGRRLENPGALFGRPTMAETLDSWRKNYERVLVVAPAALKASDAAVVGNRVDAMLFVLKLGSTPRDVADQAISGLRGAGVRLAGCVLTNAATKSD